MAYETVRDWTTPAVGLAEVVVVVVVVLAVVVVVVLAVVVVVVAAVVVVVVLAYPALRILVRGVAAFRLGALQDQFGAPKRTADTLAHKDPYVRVYRSSSSNRL